MPVSVTGVISEAMKSPSPDDGSHSLLDIAERSKMAFDSIRGAAECLLEKGLLRECLEFAPPLPAESFEGTKS